MSDERELKYVRIPVVIESGRLSYVEIRSHEHGDPGSFTMVLPEQVDGKVNLPRSLFSEEVNAWGIEP